MITPESLEPLGTASPRCAYTRTEAARMLGLSPATVDRLTKRGLLRRYSGSISARTPVKMCVGQAIVVTGAADRHACSLVIQFSGSESANGRKAGLSGG
jgi:DNA-binding Lrp family transcriptional regulator